MKGTMLKLLIAFCLLLTFAKSDPCEREKRDANPDPGCTEFIGASDGYCKGSIETAPSLTNGKNTGKIRSIAMCPNF